MPIHDWTRIFAGGFHHFHQAWVLQISDQLNHGVLPVGYFAAAEQSSGGPYPDTVALEIDVREPGSSDESELPEGSLAGGVAVAKDPPNVRFAFHSDDVQYAKKADRVAVRSLSGKVEKELSRLSKWSHQEISTADWHSKGFAKRFNS